ncbi:hypothetical protein E2C01_013877 [Portunus trituberculatus]|uniref:Uncharacterized protein n=1 Tax=Portunus trituberculatus TaxID=210409 RepID=A0A5B7DI76_PORTR|nr:hypothetical protein [Portunus trituberculatus]
MDHQVHAWRFEFKLGSHTANHTASCVRVPFSYFLFVLPSVLLAWE